MVAVVVALTLGASAAELPGISSPLDVGVSGEWVLPGARRRGPTRGRRRRAGLSGLGIDPASVGELDGVELVYGYAPDFMGHARTLMVDVDDGEGWQPVAFAIWDEDSGLFECECDLGVVTC